MYSYLSHRSRIPQAEREQSAIIWLGWKGSDWDDDVYDHSKDRLEMTII